MCVLRGGDFLSFFLLHSSLIHSADHTHIVTKSWRLTDVCTYVRRHICDSQNSSDDDDDVFSSYNPRTSNQSFRPPSDHKTSLIAFTDNKTIANPPCIHDILLTHVQHAYGQYVRTCSKYTLVVCLCSSYSSPLLLRLACSKLVLSFWSSDVPIPLNY